MTTDLHELVEQAIVEFSNFYATGDLEAMEDKDAGATLAHDLHDIANDVADGVGEGDLLSLASANPGVWHKEVAEQDGGWGEDMTPAIMLRYGLGELIYELAFESLCTSWKIHPHVREWVERAHAREI